MSIEGTALKRTIVGENRSSLEAVLPIGNWRHVTTFFLPVPLILTRCTAAALIIRGPEDGHSRERSPSMG
jgi:hypothetical protein